MKLLVPMGCWQRWQVKQVSCQLLPLYSILRVPGRSQRGKSRVVKDGLGDLGSVVQSWDWQVTSAPQGWASLLFSVAGGILVSQQHTPLLEQNQYLYKLNIYVLKRVMMNVRWKTLVSLSQSMPRERAQLRPSLAKHQPGAQDPHDNRPPGSQRDGNGWVSVHQGFPPAPQGGASASPTWHSRLCRPRCDESRRLKSTHLTHTSV